MDPFTIAALVAAVSGAAIQQQATQSAARRQQSAIQDANARQQDYQRQAEGVATRAAQDFGGEQRQDRQATAEQAITEVLAQPVQQAATAAAEAGPRVQGAVSNDYVTGTANAQAREMASAQALAQLFGRIGGAGRLRQDESINLADAGNQIDRLGNYSRGRLAADQVGIQQAGIPNGGAMLGGTLLQAGGTAALAGGLGKAAPGGAWSGNTTGMTGSWAPMRIA